MTQHKTTFAVLIVLLVLLPLRSCRSDNELQVEEERCSQLYYLTPSGCWTSCSNPKFQSCGEVFPSIYNPSFCAFTKDGHYVNYTFQCQACTNPQVLAVRESACSCRFLKCGGREVCLNDQCSTVQHDSNDKCQSVNCKQGLTCKDGQCVQDDPCATKTCDEGFTCQNGECKISRETQIEAKKSECTEPRPDETSCPTRYYFVAPTPNYCGVSADGQFVNFVEECDACKNKSIQYYWDQRCQDIIEQMKQKQCTQDNECEEGYVCQSDQCMPKKDDSADPCGDVLCNATTKCVNGECVASSEKQRS